MDAIRIRPPRAWAGHGSGPAARWRIRRTPPAANRAWLRRHGITGRDPGQGRPEEAPPDRGRAGGRPPAFDAGWYKKRNTVERCLAKLKQFSAVATRYDKRERIYQGTIDVASISIWLRDPVP